MLKGFITGTLALVVLYVVVQPGASTRAGEASNVLVAGMKRLLSPNTAGIGNHAKKVASPSSQASTSTQGKYYSV